MVNIDVLVIGAGMAGLTAASELAKKGLKVTVVEKARGSGGRLSSKRVSSEGRDDISFDLGCTGLSASTELFRKQLGDWVESGVAAHWYSNDASNKGIENKIVGLPRNSSITRHLTNGLDVQFATRISGLRKHGGHWESYIEQDGQATLFSLSQYVVIATPPQQAADLIGSQHAHHAQLENVDMLPQWVVMLALEGGDNIHERLQARLPRSISAVSLESSKEGRMRRDGVAIWQVQTSPEWTAINLDCSAEVVVETILDDLRRVLGLSVTCVGSYAHRWLYSLPGRPKSDEECWLGNDNLGFCGDYLASSMTQYGAEAAYLSGLAIAKKIT